jgi:hypothetical protein
MLIEKTFNQLFRSGLISYLATQFFFEKISSKLFIEIDNNILRLSHKFKLFLNKLLMFFM